MNTVHIQIPLTGYSNRSYSEIQGTLSIPLQLLQLAARNHSGTALYEPYEAGHMNVDVNIKHLFSTYLT